VALIDFPDDEAQKISHGLSRLFRPSRMPSSIMTGGSIPKADMPAALLRCPADSTQLEPLLQRVRRFLPEQRIAILGPGDKAPPLVVTAQHRVWCFFPFEQAVEREGAPLRRMLTFLLAPLDRLMPLRLLPGAQWRHETLVSKADKLRLSELIATCFAHHAPDDTAALYQLQLVAEEALNNSLFHAFRNPDGSEKYRVNRFTMLAPRDRLDVSCGMTNESFALAIADNAGTLSLEMLFQRLRYDEVESALWEERGRGLFLMRSCSHEAYMAVAPGLTTQMVMLFHKRHPETAKRPLLVRWDGPEPATLGPSS